jgi:hypothetical protein
MIKRLALICMTIALCLVFIGTAIALEKGNPRKGKYTYRKVYKSCMDRGAVQSPKPTVNPDAKTRAQWESAFNSRDFAQFGCKDEWNALSDEDLSDIYSYLWEFAADSPTPAKCQ